MSFDERDVRAGLDVFGADDMYLETVVRVRWEGRGWLHREAPNQVRMGAETGAASHAPIGMGCGTGVIESFSGEGLGPMPTAALGNSGPMVQTRATQYASGRDAPPRATPLVPAELLVLRVMASLDWSSFRPRLRRVSAGLIQAVSLERIVLSATAAELA